MRIGLKFQLMGMAILLVLLTVAVSSFFFTRQEKEVLLREMTRRGTTITRNLATISTDSLVSNDTLALATYVQSVMRNEGVAYAMLLNEKGDVMAHNRMENVGKAYVEPQGVRPLTNEAILIQPYRNEAGEKILDIAMPIKLRNDVLIGSAHVGMAQAASDAIVSQSFRETLWVAAGLLIIGIILSIFITDIMLRPVEELLRGAKALGEGNLNYRINIKGKGELAIVGQAFNEMAERIKGLFIGVLKALAAALASRDKTAGGHDQRVSEYATACATYIGMPPEEVENLRLAAQVQNLGHIAVPDAILEKTGKLTGEEYEKMKDHPNTGADILNQIPALRGTVPLVRHHHERFDGTGYPAGLKGKTIPLGARILAVADALDAMTSQQKHRKVLTREQAIEELKNGAGTQFDPDIVEAFIEMLHEYKGGT